MAKLNAQSSSKSSSIRFLKNVKATKAPFKAKDFKVKGTRVKKSTSKSRVIKQPPARIKAQNEKQKSNVSDKKDEKKDDQMHNLTEKAVTTAGSLPVDAHPPVLESRKRKRQGHPKDWSEILRSKRAKLEHEEYKALPELKHSLKGFNNLTGLECYRSSLTHALLNSPHLANFALEHKPKDCCSEPMVSADGDAKSGCVTCHFVQMLSLYWALPENSELQRTYKQGVPLKRTAQTILLQKSIQVLYRRLGWAGKRASQEDPAEQFLWIMRNLREELPLEAYEKLSALTEYTLKGTINCPRVSCSETHETPSNGLCWPLHVPASKTQVALEHLIKGELKERVSDYKCDLCDRIGSITKTNTIAYGPPLLIFQLKSYDDYMQKLFTKVVFPEQLDLSGFTTEKLKLKYELYSVVSHLGGSLQSGHYINHTKVGGQGWVEFNDAEVTRVKFEKVLKSGRTTPYLLFYKQS